MADFTFGNQPWHPGIFGKLIDATRRAILYADYDSGWVPTSGATTLNHKLNVIPTHIVVMTSSDPTGLNHQSDTYSACNRSSITVNGTLAYSRVRINKGA